MSAFGHHARFQQIVNYLEARTMMPTRPPSLESTKTALLKSGLFQKLDPAKNIIVAGTNGKGTVCATLSRLLHSAGTRVGLYTSPHLVYTTERIRIAEQEISKEQFVAAFDAVFTWIEKENLTHFEALTLIAAWIFYSGVLSIPVEYAIWEVGLGGRFDATNAIPHQHCGITRLGLDHQNLLGDSLTAIAAEKFGVVSKGNTVVFSPMETCLEPLKSEVIRKTNSTWVAAAKIESINSHAVRTPWGQAELALVGDRAAENTATALSLFAQLGFDPSKHLGALSQVQWPGRFQRLTCSTLSCACPIYLSGDHNPQGIESLLSILQRMAWNTLHIVIGIAHDKDATQMLQKLSELKSVKLYLTETPYKTRPLAEYPRIWREKAVTENPDVMDLLRTLGTQAQADDLIIVTGSLYLVGKVLAAAPERFL